MRDAALFGLIAAGPLGLWLLRNALVEGRPTERYAQSTASLAELATTAVQSVAVWAFPPLRVFEVRIFAWVPDAPASVRLVASAVSLAVVAALCGVGLAWRRSCRPAASRSTGVLGAFIAGYLVFMVCVCMTVKIAELGDRLLSPLYVPMLIVAGIAMDGWARRSAAVAAWAKRGVWALAFGWVALLAVHAYFDVRDGGPGGATAFRGGAWADSPTVRALADSAPEGRLYSNEPGVAYVHLPHRNDIRGLPFKEAVAETLIARHVAAGRAVSVVWFDRQPYGPRTEGYGRAEIRAWPGIRTVREFTDGAWFVGSGGERKEGRVEEARDR